MASAASSLRLSANAAAELSPRLSRYALMVAPAPERKACIQRWTPQRIAAAEAQLCPPPSSSGQTPADWDLSGLKIQGMSTLSSPWQVTRLEHAELERCQLVGQDRSMLFHNTSTQYTRFKGCHFESMSFCGGALRHVVFYDCVFEAVTFTRLQVESVLFVNCTLSRVDLSQIELRQICFGPGCQFTALELPPSGWLSDLPIAQDLKRVMGDWDAKEHTQRFSLARLDGLMGFYRYVQQASREHGRTPYALQAHYVQAWLGDEALLLRQGPSALPTIWIKRWALGYGDKPARPLMAWLGQLLILSGVYLFVGVQHSGHTINRDLVIEPSQLQGTLSDWFMCLYFSTITSTSVGFGDIHPTSQLAMLVTGAQSVLGLLLFTLFTVVLSRRVFT